MSTSTYSVVGMTCEHCVASVREEIGELPGVTGVDVDLPTGAVTVHSDRPLDDTRVHAAITEAGYRIA